MYIVHVCMLCCESYFPQMNLFVMQWVCSQTNKSSDMASLLPITVLLLLLSGSVHCQQVECSSLSTCSQCLAVPYCFWCSSFPRSAGCFLRDNTHTSCNNASYIADPEAVITVNTLPLDEDHQLSVSSVQMKLRVGEPQSFNLSVKSVTSTCSWTCLVLFSQIL